MKYLTKKLTRFKQWILSIVVGSTSSKKVSENPYMLIWYKQGWDEKQITENNTKYWKWEIDYNGFKP